MSWYNLLSEWRRRKGIWFWIGWYWCQWLGYDSKFHFMVSREYIQGTQGSEDICRDWVSDWYRWYYILHEILKDQSLSLPSAWNPVNTTMPYLIGGVALQCVNVSIHERYKRKRGENVHHVDEMRLWYWCEDPRHISTLAPFCCLSGIARCGIWRTSTVQGSDLWMELSVEETSAQG